MRKMKEVLHLEYDCGSSERDIARSCLVSRSTLSEQLRRTPISGLNRAEAATLTKAELNKRLFPA